MCVRKVSNKGESFGVKGFSRTYKNELWGLAIYEDCV